MWLADTTFLIDLINGDKGAVKMASKLDAMHSIVSISIVTVQEYLRGVYYLFGNKPSLIASKLLTAEKDLARFNCLDINYNIAKRAAKIDARLTRLGKQIGYADVLIGATAVFYQLTLLTRNVRHFDKVSSLNITQY